MSLLPLAENPFPRLVFIDCESTGLQRPSHPIEVGLAWCDGHSEAHLVRPAPSWDGWEWNAAAAGVHGIARHDLLTYGRDARWVAEWLNTSCRGHQVLSDNPEADGYWLVELFHAAGIQPEFGLLDADALVSSVLLQAPGGLAGYEELQRRVMLNYPVTHRAGDDALFWAVFFREAAALGGVTPPRPAQS